MYDRTDLEKVYSWVGRLAIIIMLTIFVVAAASAAPPPVQPEQQNEAWLERAVIVCMPVESFQKAVEGYTMVFDGFTDYGALNMLFVKEDGSYSFWVVYTIQDENGNSIKSRPPCLMSAGSRHVLLNIITGDEEYEEAK